MISKTSFFNKGIYKSTVKRYSWGAILYFVMLFMFTGLAVFLNIDKDYYRTSGYYRYNSLILNGSYMAIPILMAIVVPTIVALLVFRFIHSKKQAVFIHSIPVCRKANFISSILAAFTLMSVPVIINGLILMLISVCGYGNYFTVSDCFVWMGYNLLGLFMMFSVAVLASNLTGNSFAAVVINILIHSFLFIIVLTLGVMADAFLYGFDMSNSIYDSLAENNFTVVVFSFVGSYFHESITFFDIAKYVFFSVVLYLCSYFLYSRRRQETASDVAGYKCLNNVFKYLATFMATMFGFAVFSTYIEENTVVFAIIVAVISIIAYAASEMVLKKTLNVLYAWKGYVCFSVLFIAMVMLFSQTSFFGYETRIPDKEDIEEATIYNYYRDEEPFSSDSEIIDTIISIHEEITEEDTIPKLNHKLPEYTRLHIKYKLKTGDEIYRVYPVSYNQCTDFMNKVYESEEYKKKSEWIFVDDNRITRMSVTDRNGDWKIAKHEELLSAMREDVLRLSYEDMYSHYSSYDTLYNIHVEYEIEEADNDGKPRAYISGMYLDITDKYERTVKWLEDNGYESFKYEDREKEFID